MLSLKNKNRMMIYMETKPYLKDQTDEFGEKLYSLIK
jgi:hypothetical protein